MCVCVCELCGVCVLCAVGGEGVVLRVCCVRCVHCVCYVHPRSIAAWRGVACVARVAWRGVAWRGGAEREVPNASEKPKPRRALDRKPISCSRGSSRAITPGKIPETARETSLRRVRPLRRKWARRETVKICPQDSLDL